MGEALVDLTGGCCEKISFTSGEDMAGNFLVGVCLQEWTIIGSQGAYTRIGEGVYCRRPIFRRPDAFLDVFLRTGLIFQRE